MSEMSDKEKLFIFMAHADDLQKIADASHKELQAAAIAVKEMAKLLPEEVSRAVSNSVSEIAGSHLIGPLDKAGAKLVKVVAAANDATRGLWLYPAVIVGVILAVLSGYTYFGVHWLRAERDRAKDELAAINHELAQTANVRLFTSEDGEEQFWVEIDPTKKTGNADGKTWARMPRR